MFSQSFVLKQYSRALLYHVLELQQQILIFNLHILFCSQTMTDVETTFRKLNYTMLWLVFPLFWRVLFPEPMALPPTHKIVIK